jgi:hypothetical protein
MNRAGSIRAVVLLSSLILGGRTVAEDSPTPRAGMLGVGLLVHPIVQSELKLDGDQVAKVRPLASKLQARQNELFLKREGLSGEDRTKQIQEGNATLDEEANRAFAGLLRPEQLARFGQIALQKHGASSWLDPAVARSLDVKPEQAETLRKILDRAMIRRREAQSNTRGNRRASLEKLHVIEKETDAEAVALLTPEQASTWKSMIGEPLDLDHVPDARAGR